MFISGVAQGLGEGMKNIATGEIKREQVNELKAQAEYNSKMRPMQLQNAQLQNDQLNMQIKNMETNFNKLMLQGAQNDSFSYIDEYYKEGTEEDPELLNTAFVQNKTLNNMMANNKALGTNLGQITDIKDNQDGTLTLTNSLTGKSKQVPENMFLSASGYFNKRDAVQVKRASAEYEKKMNKIKMAKESAEVGKIKAQTNEANAKAAKARRPEANGLSIKDELYIKEKMISIMGKKADLETGNLIGEVDKISNTPGKEKEVYEMIAGNTNLYGKIFPTQADKTQIKNGSTALKLSQGLRKLQGEMDKAIDSKDVGGLVNAGLNYLAKYGIGTDSQVSSAALSEALRTKGESLTADQLKLITGAAFNETEMEIKLKPLIAAIAGYDGSKVAKSKMDAAIEQWDRTASSYISPLSHTQQAFIKGSVESDTDLPEPPKTFEFGGKSFNVGDTRKTKDGRVATLNENGKWMVE